MINESRLTDYIDRLPRLPTTVTKIVEIANSMSSSPSDLMQVVKFDPVLTAKVLKLINSAYFGMPQKVSSLTRAVILLGINTIKNLALSTSVMSTITLKKSLPEFNIDLFWEHSLGCAVVSKILAALMKIPKKDLEEYFIAGLIHDIGKILLVQAYPSEYEQVLIDSRNNKTSHLTEEENILGITHSKVGGMIIKKWELPESLLETIEQHHSPISEGDSLKLKFAVHIADIYCVNYGYAVYAEDFNIPLAFTDEMEELLGITKEDINNALTTLSEEIEKAKVFLQANN